MKNKTNIKFTHVSFEVAFLAKQHGFDERCRNYYKEREGIVTYHYSVDKRLINATLPQEDGSNFYLRPTQGILVDWIKRHYNINLEVLWGKEAKAFSILINDRIVFVNDVVDYQDNKEAMDIGLLEVLANL